MSDAERAPSKQQPSLTAAFASVTTLFFAWGLITSLVDPLVAAVKSIFTLSNLEAQLSAFAFFIAYGVFSIPAAMLVARLKSVWSVVLAICLMIVACLIIMGAANIDTYEGVLCGLFVMASGITILQVAANPLAAALGPPEKSHFRLTFSQAFNALGTVVGPLVGAHLLLDGIEVLEGEVLTETVRDGALGSIDFAFLIISFLLAALAIFIWFSRKKIKAGDVSETGAMGFAQTLKEVRSSKWALLGGAAIFLYVGSEVAIGTQMALFLNDDAIWSMSLQQAGYYVSFYWFGAMVGRFLGSALLLRIRAPVLMAAATACAALLCLFVLVVGGVPAGYAALAIGLFNSIMFPVIFSITLERSSAAQEATSAFLCMSIIGGAFLPLMAGSIADAAGYVMAFIVPLAGYVLLHVFAQMAMRSTVVAADDHDVAAIH